MDLGLDYWGGIVGEGGWWLGGGGEVEGDEVDEGVEG